MFEDYLQDSYEFLLTAQQKKSEGNDREARRYFRASIFYASGAMEAFVNYLADSFAQAGTIPRHEICFLNDKHLVYSVEKGLTEKTQFHKVDEKIRLLIGRFAIGFDFQSAAWSGLIDFKSFRDSLIHPRQSDDVTPLGVYEKKVRTGLNSIIEIMNIVLIGIYGKPLRKQILDLIPDSA